MRLRQLTRSFCLCTCTVIFAVYTYGQKNELSVNAYSGLFSFHGNGSVKTSRFTDGFNLGIKDHKPPKTYNIHGRRNAFSYTIEAGVMRNTKMNLLYGMGISYEVLTSKVNIDSFVYYGEPVTSQYDAIGYAKLKNTFFTISPVFGKRFLKNKFAIDILAGFDLAFCLKSHEKGRALLVNIGPYYEVIETNNDVPKPNIDFRPRVQIQGYYKRMGLLLGYSLGLSNYHLDIDDLRDKTKSYTGFLRVGLSYKLVYF